MKRIKKLASILLAMVMVLTMALPVMASEPTEVKQNATLTIKGDVKAGKQYDLYRVFDLTYSEADGNKHYSYTVNNAFKGYFTANDIEDPVVYLEGLEKNSSDLSVLAQNLLKYAVDNKIERAVETVKATEADETARAIKVANLPFGYYLLNPLGGSTPTEGFATMFALNTLSGSDMEIVLKATYPEIDKNVTDDNEETPDKQDETSIGKVVTFHLTKMKVPDTTDYNRYWFVIEDKLSEGLTFKEITSVKIGSKTLTASEYTLTGPTKEVVNDIETGKTVIRLAIKDFKDLVTNNNILVGADITVDYTATLNENAVVNAPNTNEVTLIYSNDPTSEYDGDEPGPDSDAPTGVTPPSTTATYTTALRINKTDGSNPLQGAAFKISGTGVKTVVTTYGEFEEAANGTHWKLKDGTYTTTDPNGEGIDKSVYAEPLTTKYELVTKTNIKKEATETTEVEAYTDAQGHLTFKGLGEGEYRISETVVPSGYNAIDDFPVKITFVPGADPDKKYEGGTFEVVRGKYDKDGNAVYENGGTKLGYDSTIQAYPMEVVNETGSLLPSTGGIGTTIFYVVGAVLVIGAGILLVTKKRMSAR